MGNPYILAYLLRKTSEKAQSCGIIMVSDMNLGNRYHTLKAGFTV